VLKSIFQYFHNSKILELYQVKLPPCKDVRRMWFTDQKIL